MSPSLGELVALAVIALTLLGAAAVRALCRGLRLERLREDHARAEAAAEGCPDCGEYPCKVHDGIFWMALEQAEGLK